MIKKEKKTQCHCHFIFEHDNNLDINRNNSCGDGVDNYEKHRDAKQSYRFSLFKIKLDNHSHHFSENQGNNNNNMENRRTDVEQGGNERNSNYYPQEEKTKETEDHNRKCFQETPNEEKQIDGDTNNVHRHSDLHNFRQSQNIEYNDDHYQQT